MRVDRQGHLGCGERIPSFVLQVLSLWSPFPPPYPVPLAFAKPSSSTSMWTAGPPVWQGNAARGKINTHLHRSPQMSRNYRSRRSPCRLCSGALQGSRDKQSMCTLSQKWLRISFGKEHGQVSKAPQGFLERPNGITGAVLQEAVGCWFTQLTRRATAAYLGVPICLCGTAM